MTTQSGNGGLRGPSTVVQGGTMNIDVGPNDRSVDVGSGQTSFGSSRVDPAKGAAIPVPPVPAGSVVWIAVGTGLRRRFILIEVVSSF